jgi:2-amino-4-hydroxy-6-hydroxymethyldihydropteridine diphosphokinase
MIMKKVFLGLGTNMGDRTENLSKAVKRIEIEIGRVLKTSSVYETEPWGFHSEEQFLNLVLCAETVLPPGEVLKRILAIETLLGRVRGGNQYVSRVIDIDILLYEDLIIEEKNLKIPHPLLHERKFVLVPLCEIDPDLMHPGLGKTLKDLLKICPDNSKVQKAGLHDRTTARPHDH